MMLRSLLFDLDNTLVDRASAHRRYWENFLSRHPDSARGANSRTLLRRLIEEDEQGYRPRKDYFTWVSTALSGQHWDAEMLWKDYRQHLPSLIQPRPEVTRAIECLACDYELAIISNGSGAGQRQKLETAGLNKLFSKVWISEECGFEKPSAQIFLIALSELDCKPEHALFIGDDPVRDIDGAARVGCNTCWISYGRAFPRELESPDITISTIIDLVKALTTRPAPGQKQGLACST